MANIPTAQIPNVQSGVGNLNMAPSMSFSVPRLESMPVLPRSAFDGVGAGLVGLSKGMWEGAQLLNEFAGKMAQVNDNAQFAAMDRKYTETMADFEIKASTLPPDKHVELWEKDYLPKLKTELEGVRATPEGKARILDRFNGQLATSTAGVRISANKQFLTLARQEGEAYIDRKATEGNMPEAFAGNARMTADGLQTPAEEKAREHKLIVQSSKQTADLQVRDLLAFGTVDDIEDAEAQLNGAVSDQSFQTERFSQLNGKPAVMRQYQDAFGKLKREAYAERFSQAVAGIVEGDYGTFDELVDTYGDMLPAVEMQKLEEVFSQTPEQQAQKLAQRPALINAIDMYDPTTDPESRQFDRLLGWVHSMPAGYQADLSQMLRDRKKDAQPKPSSVVTAFIEKEKQLFEQGEYGPIRDDADWQSAKVLQGRVLDKFNNWVRANPKEASDPLKTSEAYNAIKTQTYQEDMGDDQRSNMRVPKPVNPADLPRQILNDQRIRPPQNMEQETSDLLDNMSDAPLPPVTGAWSVTPKTRSELRAASTASRRQVSLDFNDLGPKGRRVEIVIPYNATKEETAAAKAYVERTVEFFRAKGIDMPDGQVLTKTGNGELVSRFHTEPFNAHDKDSYQAVRDNPDEYAAILEDTLGRVANVTFIAPHTAKAGGAQNDETNERDFARTHLIPALQRRKGETQVARNE